MKLFNRVFSIMMTVILLLTVFSASTTSLAAAKKVKSVKLNKTEISIYVGKTYTLTATVAPSDATNKKLTWTTSDKSIVAVSSGKIAAKKVGTATITAKATDGSGKKATCKVTVKKCPVKSVSLNKTSASLYVGSSLILKATVSPSNATNKKVVWKSANTQIATVDSSGKVTAKKSGSTGIYVITVDGKQKAVCKITVKNRPVQAVELNKTSASIYSGNSVTLKATLSPSNATNKKIVWKSSNTSVAVVNSSGKVTGKKAGTATVYAISADGNKKAACKITVKNYYTVDGTSIGLSATDYVWVPVNGGTKFHRSSECSNMSSPKKVTVKVAVENGYSACKKCFK